MNTVDTNSLESAGAATLPAGRPAGKARARKKPASIAATQKRAVFGNNWLGFAFAIPQLLLIFTFFYWPASQAIYWAFTLQGPWGGGNTWVGLDNIKAVVTDRSTGIRWSAASSSRRCRRASPWPSRWCWRCWSTAN